MDVIITTKSFNLNQLQAFYCHHFIKESIENGDKIKIVIEDDKISSLVSCLTINAYKYDMLYQNNANLSNKSDLILGRMEQYQRIKIMCTEIISAISEHPDLTIEDLN